MDPTLREATEADVPAMLEIYNDAAVNTTATATADESPISLEARLQWFRERKALNLPILVFESAGEVVAWGALSPYSPKSGYRFSVENSVYVRTDSRGLGLGRAMLVELIGRAKAGGYHTIIASIDAENLASIRLHESLGFVEAARYRELFRKFGRWLDVVHLQLLIE